MENLTIKTDSSITAEIETIIFPWMKVDKNGISYYINAEIKIKEIPEELKHGWSAEWLLRLMGRSCLYLNLDPPKAQKIEPKISIWESIVKRFTFRGRK